MTMAKKMNLSAYKRNPHSQDPSDNADSPKKATPAKSKGPERKEGGSSSTKPPLQGSTGKERTPREEPKESRSAGTELPIRSSTEKEQSLSDGIRLNRYIAHCGVCSRREADQLIADGKIKVNKKLVTEMGFKVMPGDNSNSALATPPAKAYRRTIPKRLSGT